MIEQIENFTLNKKAWLRYMARLIDMMVGSVVVAIIFMILFIIIVGVMAKVGIISVEVVFEIRNFLFEDGSGVLERTPSIVFATVSIFFYLFVEAKLISRYGTTPFKKLFGISIVDKNGGKISYKTSLIRAFMVWIRGLALSLPLLSLVTLILSYNRYTEQGTSPWDEENNLIVQHKQISDTRFFIGIIIFISIFILNVVASFS